MNANANLWLERYRDRRPFADPKRSTPVIETFETGDVMADGSILTSDGIFLVKGCVWLTEKKADAAAYYGWQLVGPERGTDRHTGETIFPMQRI